MFHFKYITHITLNEERRKLYINTWIQVDEKKIKQN
jgi:hypothetical protein